MPTKLTHEIITAAIEGFEAQKRRIDTQIAELRGVLSGGPAAAATAPEAPTRKRKRFSAPSRRKMGMAQKGGRARIRGESDLSESAEDATQRRRFRSQSRRTVI